MGEHHRRLQGTARTPAHPRRQPLGHALQRVRLRRRPPVRGRLRAPPRVHVFETEHPVVHVHPETGERSLLLGHFVKGFTGLKPREFQDLFSAFQDRITKEDNTFRWNWNDGDVVLWDNHATQHYGVKDFGDHHRKIRRVTLAGAVPTAVGGERSRIITGNATDFSVIAEPRPLVGYLCDAADL
ncbi:MAG: TauD/TfdA family dioxygenase [Corynebacterium sp.]|nr:TauD/TfdA family dioxygenase [Corynebacterium sp.]